jgi:magnesium transporter
MQDHHEGFMEVFVYRQGADHVEEAFTIEHLPALLADKTNVVWVDLRGETDEEKADSAIVLKDVFKFHYLTIEDCLETRNQPKIEVFPDYIYMIVHGVKPDETSSANFVTKELDMFLGDNYLVTFHAQRFKSIKDVKQQIRSSTYICQRGSAYLLHQILDHIVDLYMPIVDDFDNTINELEDRIFLMKRGNNEMLQEIMDLRRSVARMRRISARQLDVLYRISHGEFSQIPEKVLPFFRDVYDHLLRISDLSESYRDLVTSLFDIHFSVNANRQNEVMKTLTIVSAIILPLSLIAGIYGMNFENMPELHSPNGYYLTLFAMVVVTILLLIYFWWKGWIFESGDDVDKSGGR